MSGSPLEEGRNGLGLALSFWSVQVLEIFSPAPKGGSSLEEALEGDHIVHGHWAFGPVS